MGQYGDIEIEFDFEDAVREILPKISEAPTANGLGSFGKLDPKLRTVVCRHWLQGLCQKGDKCDYLHRLDKSRMPPCKHGKSCKIKNCPLKHVDEEERPECVFFKQGFCMHGPSCKYRHIKRPPDECPQVAVFEEYSASNNQSIPQKNGKRKAQNPPNQFYKITLCKHWLEHGNCPYHEDCHYAHGENELKSFSGSEDLEDNDIIDMTRNIMNEDYTLPFSVSSKASYFICHAPDLRSLVISKRRNCWSISNRFVTDFNTSFTQSDHVLLFFVVRSFRGVYGLARMESLIPPPPLGHVAPLMSPEFPISWIRTCRVSLKLIAQLRMSGGLSLGRTTVDGRIDKSAG